MISSRGIFRPFTVPPLAPRETENWKIANLSGCWHFDGVEKDLRHRAWSWRHFCMYLYVKLQQCRKNLLALGIRSPLSVLFTGQISHIFSSHVF